MSLDSVGNFFQNTVGSISFSSIDHRWLIIAFAVFAVAVIVFSQEKTKAISILLVVYGLWLIATYIPGVMDWLEKTLVKQDLFIVKIIFGVLPIVALITLKKRRVPRTRP